MWAGWVSPPSRALIATFIAVVLATLCAYAIARLDFPGKKLVLTTALVVSMFPVISIVTPLFNLWRQVGLYDTWLGLIIPYLSLTLPISIWTLAAYFQHTRGRRWIWLKVQSALRAVASSERTPVTTSTPWVRSHCSPPDATGLGSDWAMTTRAIPASTRAWLHGPVRPV